MVWGRSGVLHTVQQAIENQHLDLESERSARENQKIQAAGRHLELLDMDSQHLAAHADFAKDGEKTGANLRIESMKKATKARGAIESESARPKG